MARKNKSAQESGEDVTAKPAIRRKDVSKAIRRNKAAQSESLCNSIAVYLKEYEESDGDSEQWDQLRMWLREAVAHRNAPVVLALQSLFNGCEKERFKFVELVYEMDDPHGALFLIQQWKSGRRLVAKLIELEYEWAEHRVIINHLLANPSAEHDHNLFRFAAKFQDMKAFERLLREERIANPGTHENYAIRHAAASGNVEMVKRLQQFRKQVDQTAWNNYALRHARANGHQDVVEVLLKRSAAAG